ncbi:MAG TPA: DNA mismatch repair protein MutS [Gemmataceae bacterium]|nr:DNA mismatch repair protein MutS [Gemmataceae bacterium]
MPNDSTGYDTKMMQQYLTARQAHPGMILLFHMGDFYETFGDDAELVSRLLGLTLTSRDGKVPMAGFPVHALEPQLRKLLHLGHRVAICDQVEDPAVAKGLVKREVTRVVTPGTITEEELLDPREPNHLVGLHISGTQVGLAWVELSTGSFHAADLPDDKLGDELARLNPAEALASEMEVERVNHHYSSRLSRPVLARPNWTFDPVTAKSALFHHFGVLTLNGFGFVDEQPCITAAGALLIYLQETLKSKLAHLRALRPYQPEKILQLDEVTRRSLELTRTLRDSNREGSLLSVLDRTVTPMGARLLHDWLVYPLTERTAIESRLDAVAEFLAEHSTRLDLRASLQDGCDLQRLTARVCTGRATPRDLAAVGRTLRTLPGLKAKITGRKSGLLRQLEGKLELCPDIREAIDTALVQDPPQGITEGGIIREGYHAELDQLRKLASDGKGWIARYQAQEITRTGINSLKVGFNQVHGYYIEVTHTHAAKIPPDYQRKQTLKNAERYYTPELKEYEEKVLSAEEKSKQLEQQLFIALREKVAAQTPRLLATADVLAALDVLSALAELAGSRQYCRPVLSDQPILEIEQGRHPMLDQTLPPGTFVPNDVRFGPDDGRFWLITGPNMSGKSTFIRQVALITLLAHIGSFVPARNAKVGITDRIFTRVGASDELSRGQSTFMVEMTEAANILNNATTKSLVILDEIGRGTSTYDGVSLAWAMTEYLHDIIGCRALFATHYHELAQLSETLPHLRNYNVLVQEDEDKVIFLHRIAAGSAERSYGIHVAQLAGVPSAVLRRAQTVLTELETRHHLPAAAGKEPPVPTSILEWRRRRTKEIGPTLFGEADGAR